MTDLWIKAHYPLGPFASPPMEQAVADVLAKAPWAGWTTGKVGFTYEFVDRPEAGTALLAMTSPPTRPTPSDGVRYLYGEPNEARTVTHHTVSVPTSFTTPTQNTRMQVELECLTAMAGHLPPLSPAQPLQLGSEDMRLTRFRKRWRILNGQYPGLWFYFWGKDDSGGTGQGAPPATPAGWERTPVRGYPLVKPNGVPTAPIYPFPDPSKFPPGAAAAPGTPQARPATGTNPAAAAGGATSHLTPQQMQQLAASASASSAANNPYAAAARQQQLAALAAAAGQNPLAASASGGAGGALEARQAQYQAQQQAVMAAAAAAAAAQGNPRMQGAGGGYGLTPQQIQQQMQAAQQQQLLAAQQQAQQAQLAAAANAGTPIAPRLAQPPPPQPLRKPAPPPSSAAVAAQQPAAGPPPASTRPSQIPSQYEDETPLHDIFDVLPARTLAAHRYAKQHDLFASLFSPWTAGSVLEGRVRKREIDELLQTNGISARTGEPRSGTVPGLGREGVLGTLGSTVPRIAVFGALGKSPESVLKGTGGGVEERRERLERMRRELEGQIEGLEERFEGQRRGLEKAGQASVA